MRYLLLILLLVFGWGNEFGIKSYKFPIEKIDLIMEQIVVENRNRYDEILKRYCGDEDKMSRKYHMLDLNNDGYDDILVFSNFSGFRCGADFDFYLTSILNFNNEYKLANYIYVGGKGWSVPVRDSLIFKNDTLIFSSLRYSGETGYYDSLVTSKVSIDDGFLKGITQSDD